MTVHTNTYGRQRVLIVTLTMKRNDTIAIYSTYSHFISLNCFQLQYAKTEAVPLLNTISRW